ncbi:hypothetical protein CTEN210_04015 [Chaetoceros tenuissimus]|uniref:Uncharacterized protein n=1 Tax=Chaetoceros tenuissimus TaxID=426638 RepID=A0AAD3H240_9STRA|nr:hypothetical protein CTEN210_04015 [Chaetoceros tenuissimus]
MSKAEKGDADDIHFKSDQKPEATTSQHSQSESDAKIVSNTYIDAMAEERQVIAVSASKNPAAFFNLARRFLMTDEYCDLSALEGAIVSAVDAAHLLERSKLATIVRVQTSYVSVELKKKTSNPKIANPALDSVLFSPQKTSPRENEMDQKPPHQGKRNTPVRRARIIITVRRTDDYKKWLEENDAHALTEESEVTI